MGLLDSVLGALAGNAGASNPLVGTVSRFLDHNGGIQGLGDKFQQAGLGEVFASWVGTDANQPVTPEQVEQVLGSEQVSGIAAKIGMDSATTAGYLAQFLPKIVDHLTPAGRIDPDADREEALAKLIPSLLMSFGGGG